MTAETDRIEQDIQRSRTALNDTIEQLGGKLSPGQMLDEAIGLAQGQAGQLTANLARQVRDNPLPLLLIAAGVGLLAVGHSRGSRRQPKPSMSHEEWLEEMQYRSLEAAKAGISRTADETEAAFADRLHGAEAKALELKQNAGETIDAFKARVRSFGDSLSNRTSALRARMSGWVDEAAAFASAKAEDVKSAASDVRQSAQDLYQDYPLAAGAVAMAVGAILGAAAPLSGLEREKLRAVADRAGKVGADLAEQGAKAVGAGAEKAGAAFH